MDKKNLLWLDDIRNPTYEIWNNYIAKNIGNPLEMNIIWIKNFHNFKLQILTNGLPDIVSFDHDLENFHISKSTYIERTGYDCAKWLVNHCMQNNLDFPQYHVHSANPVGKENIQKYIINYLKIKE